MIKVKLTGIEDFRRAAKAIRVNGRKDLQKELLRGIRDATKPIGRTVREHLPTYMPRRYAPVLSAALRFTTKTKTSGWPEVTVTARAKGKFEPRRVTALDKGTLRHPLFGMRKHWYAQKIPPGFFTKPANTVLDEVRAEASRAVERAARQLEKEI